MCFIINDDCPNAIVAIRNIRVYKRLRNLKITKRGNLIGRSPYLEYIWYKGKVISFKKKLKIVYRKVEGACLYTIDEGFHAYTNINAAISHRGYCNEDICEFFIPKGSTYYINCEKIVSNSMIWSGRIWSFTSKRWRKVSKTNK